MARKFINQTPLAASLPDAGLLRRERCGIYYLFNSKAGMYYVGCSVRTVTRVGWHERRLELHKHKNTAMQVAWVTDGREAFTAHMVLYCDPEDLLFYEQRVLGFFVSKYGRQSLYNEQMTVRWWAGRDARERKGNNRDLLIVDNLTLREEQRLRKQITLNEASGCWEWQGAKDDQGYGLVWFRGHTERTHRVLYALTAGPLPRGFKARRDHQVDHLCRNTTCCNPAHLELKSQRANVLIGEGCTALAARKTSCKYGHPLTIAGNRGRRECRICDGNSKKARTRGPKREYWLQKNREAQRRYIARKREVAS